MLFFVITQQEIQYCQYKTITHLRSWDTVHHKNLNLKKQNTDKIFIKSGISIFVLFITVSDIIDVLIQPATPY